MDDDASVAPTLITPPPPGSSLLGRKAGSFTLIRELGRGGMGTVYLGEHELIGSRVAVKVLHPHLAADPALVQRFFAEARAVNLIGHENIVRIFDMSRLETGEWYLVMEYLAGQPLSTFAHKPLAERTAEQLLVQLCDALEAAHQRGIVHRDVKPENVFVLPRADGTLCARLLDFGIARFFGDGLASARTATGLVLGTPAYMAPEQWDRGTIDARTDLYALGVMGFWLVTGKNPFGDLPLTELLLAQQQRRVPEEGKRLSPPLREVLLKAMAPKQEERFRSAAELRDALRAAVARPQEPLPLSSRELARFKAELDDGMTQREVECVDLSRAGAYVCCAEELPPLRARVGLTLALPGGELSCRGEVVRHVPASLAESWHLPPGFAVQFVDSGRAFAETLDRLLHPKLTAVRADTSTREHADEDPRAAARLRELACRLTGDPYALLGAPLDAHQAEIRRKGQALLDELSVLGRAPLGTDSKDRHRRLLEQVRLSVWTLGDPSRRAAWDGAHGNPRGVARSLSAGLSITELEKLRSGWLSEHGRNASRAQLHRITGDLHLSREERDAALAEYEKALALDPLNVDLHRALAALQRELSARERSA